uniref:C2H2-type domain-containing protein n=1 Tax=Mimiviridae sp. ChoanoV1 TaxID=2596887 RepID=A0A5B8HW85_9VIRU|nr:hypothetical protein 2_35 [Mimiviridae sp. ChoanoV1]
MLYACGICNFYSKIKHDFNRHMNTKKHFKKKFNIILHYNINVKK